MNKKQQRAQLIEAERRLRGERTSALNDEELCARVKSGVLELPSALRKQADSLALPVAKSVELSGGTFAPTSRAMYAGYDSRLQPVAYDSELGSLQPYKEIESIEVPCKITLDKKEIDPAIIETMPVANRGAAHTYLDASQLDTIEPSALLLPAYIRQAIHQLDYPDRGVFGEGLACVHHGKLLIIQTVDHLCSNEFFRCGDIVGSDLLNKDLLTLVGGQPYSHEVLGTNEINYHDVQRVLSLDWRGRV